jgi:hypothetical protein
VRIKYASLSLFFNLVTLQFFFSSYSATDQIGPWPPHWGFLIVFRHSVGLLWTSDQPVAKPLPTHDNTTQTRMQTSMPRAGLKPTIAVTKRAIRRKADSHLTTRHRHYPTTTLQKNLIAIEWNGPVHIQRQRHDSDTLLCLCRWMWTGPFKVTVTIFSAVSLSGRVCVVSLSVNQPLDRAATLQ